MNTPELAGLLEVDHGGEERRRLDAGAPVGGRCGHRIPGLQICEGRGEQGATQAVSDRVDTGLPGRLLDRVQRGDGAFEQVIVHALVRQPFVRIHPRDHEHRMPLVHRPLDERVLRAEIQDVVLVDPRRNDEQRALAHRVGGGRVLEELHQIVLEDDLAGGDGDVLAQLELVEIGHPDPESPLSPFEILEQVRQPPARGSRRPSRPCASPPRGSSSRNWSARGRR